MCFGEGPAEACKHHFWKLSCHCNKFVNGWSLNPTKPCVGSRVYRAWENIRVSGLGTVNPEPIPAAFRPLTGVPTQGTPAFGQHGPSPLRRATSRKPQHVGASVGFRVRGYSPP